MESKEKETLTGLIRETHNLPDEKKKIMLWVGTGMDLANVSKDTDPEQKETA